MRTGTVAFLSGILLLLQFSALPAFSVILFLLPTAIILLRYKSFFRYAGILLLGFSWSLFRAELILAEKLPKEIEGQTLQVTGRVVSLPEQDSKRTRFEFLIDRLLDESSRQWPSPGKVRLNWYASGSQPVPGQEWHLTVRLKRPYGFRNPGGFDYEAWLFQQRLRASGYVVHDRSNKYTGTSKGQYINRLRYSLRQKIVHNSGQARHLGLIIGLGLGDRSYITPHDREVLVRTGTNHLLAISGLHIGLVAGLFYILARRFWSLCGSLPLCLAAPRFAAVAAIIGACAYALLAGMSIPTQRSLIMVIVIMLSLFSYQRHAFSAVLCFAMLLVLIYDPFAVLAPGFWLSFFAIALIAYGMMNRVDANRFWWRWGRPQYIVALGLIPLPVFWFQQFAVVGLVANLAAIPWVGMVIVPLVLVALSIINVSETAGHLLVTAAHAGLELLWPLLEQLASPDIAVWQLSAPPLWAFAAALFGVVLLLQPRGLPARWLGLVWMLPLLFPVRAHPARNEFWLTLLDVGQGLSAVIQTRNHTLVYDTGARFNETFSAGSAVVVPYLRQANIDRIDLLIISHGDNDHIGGSSDILADYPQASVLTSVPEKINRPRVAKCFAGQHWMWDGISFAMLHPGPGFDAGGNNSSCVLKVGGGEQAILLTGDIEREAERHLVAEYGKQLSASVLVAPHHGSKTSSSIEFIHAVQPELVLFPAGYRNRFRFPNKDIIARYAAADIKLYDSARHGAMVIKFDQSGMSVTSYRQTGKRFWHTEF